MPASMQLRRIIEYPTQSKRNELSFNQRLEEGRKFLFNFDYPFYDSEKKADFETTFIENFYMQEIGFETEELFRFRLKNWLKLNMPKWNRILEAELLEYDPFEIVNYTRNTDRNLNVNENGKSDSTLKQTDNSTTNGEANSNQDVSVDSNNRHFTRDLESQTPDDRLAITTNDGAGVIEYATTIQENLNTTDDSQNTNSTSKDTTTTESNSNSNNEANSTSNRTQNDDEKFAEHVKGNYGSQSYMELLQKYRDVQINIYKMMFDEMQVLFMQVY